MLKGIDVSRNDGHVDFAKVKNSGVNFAYIKATEGATFRDPMHQVYAYNAMKEGLPIGFYHYARPDHNAPEKEVQNFVEALSVFKYDLLPVLDLEVKVNMSDTHLYQWARTFVNEVKAKTGHDVMFYTYTYYLEQYPALKDLHDLPLWIAYYSTNNPTVHGWSNWAMWQFTETERIPGVEGYCDVNYVRDLNDILIHKNVEKPVVDPHNKPVVNPHSNKPAFKRVLKLTHPPMQGEDVKILQKRLNVTPVDGIFGQATEESVKEWQRLHDKHGHVVPPGKGLTVDGIVGQETWNALFN